MFGPRLPPTKGSSMRTPTTIKSEQDATLMDDTLTEVEKLHRLLSLSAELTEYWADRALAPHGDFYPTAASIADPEVRRMMAELERAVQP